MTKEQEIKDFIKQAITNTPFETCTYFVGGCVRDMVMGRQSKDIDILVDMENGEVEFANYLCNNFPIQCKDIVLFSRFRVAKFTCLGESIEVVVPRSETYEEHSRKPDVKQTTLLEDVKRRDFTINTLLQNVSSEEVIDLTGKGIEDIKNKVIRTVNNPDIVFFDDGLRLLRAIRQSGQFGFSIEENTLNGIVRNAFRLQSISVERIQDELNNILLKTINPSGSIEMLRLTGLLKYILPELEGCYNVTQNDYHKKDVYGHILDVLEQTLSLDIPKEELLKIRLACLLHDIAKPLCKTIDENNRIHFYNHEFEGNKLSKEILKRLKYSNEYNDDISFMVINHMRTKSFGDDLIKIKDKSIRKLVHELGDKRELVLHLIDADNKSHSENHSMPNQVDNIKKRIEELGYENKFEVTIPINGEDVITEFNLSPSPLIKDILSYVRKLCYSQPDMTKEQAIKQIKNYLKDKK